MGKKLKAPRYHKRTKGKVVEGGLQMLYSNARADYVHDARISEIVLPARSLTLCYPMENANKGEWAISRPRAPSCPFTSLRVLYIKQREPSNLALCCFASR